jgi:hypothetical protein
VPPAFARVCRDRGEAFSAAIIRSTCRSNSLSSTDSGDGSGLGRNARRRRLTTKNVRRKQPASLRGESDRNGGMIAYRKTASANGARLEARNRRVLECLGIGPLIAVGNN